MKKNKSTTITRLIFKNFVICLSLLIFAIWFFSRSLDAILTEYMGNSADVSHTISRYESTEISAVELEARQIQAIIFDENFNVLEKIGPEILTQDTFTSVEVTQIVSNSSPEQIFYADFMPVKLEITSASDTAQPQQEQETPSVSQKEIVSFTLSQADDSQAAQSTDAYALLVQHDSYLAPGKYNRAITMYMWSSYIGNVILILLSLILFVRLLYKPLKMNFKIIEENIIKTPYENSHIDKNIATLREAQAVLESYNMMIDAIDKETKEKENAYEQNSQLVSNLAHDLKSPITVLRGYAEVLLTSNPTKKEQNEYLNYIGKSANELDNLISLLFEQIKYKKGENMKFEKADINAILRDVCANYYMIFDKSGFNFEANIADESYVSSVDIVRMKRVFTNLLQNILSHNKTPTDVLVSSKITDKYIEIEFQDNGTGISKENGEKIFDAFFQEDTSRNKQSSGLGLYICKEIIKKHNGTIYLKEPQGDDYKTVFTIKIP